MKIWQRLLGFLTPRSKQDQVHEFHISDDLHAALHLMAQQNGRSEYDLTMDLIASGYAQQQISWELMKCWQSLTPREREVVTLICCNYTNHQIAERLVVTVETVRTHVRRSLKKFGVGNRRELILLLAGWQFSERYLSDQANDLDKFISP